MGKAKGKTVHTLIIQQANDITFMQNNSMFPKVPMF